LLLTKYSSFIVNRREPSRPEVTGPAIDLAAPHKRPNAAEDTGLTPNLMESGLAFNAYSLGTSSGVSEGGENMHESERIVRLVIYWLGIGFFLDLGLFFARYNRHNESHDEFHFALMFITIVSGIACDIWFAIRAGKKAFNNGPTYETYFILIIWTTFLGICLFSTNSSNEQSSEV
jgi:hypothetical protein